MEPKHHMAFHIAPFVTKETHWNDVLTDGIKPVWIKTRITNR